MRFLVDENLPAEVAELLTQAGHDAIDVGASPRRGAPDAVVWRWAAEEDRILVTRDLDFPLPIHLERPAGLVLLRPRPDARTRDIMGLFRALLATVDAGALRDSIAVVEPGRVRQRPWSRLPLR